MAPDRFLLQHRQMLWTLCACFIAFSAWVVLAQLDIIVTASGKLSPSSAVPVAQATSAGVVRKILVTDGQAVVAGQALVELDAVSEQEAVSAATAEARSLELQLRRLEGELQGAPPQIDDASVFAEYISRKGAQDALLQEAIRTRERSEAELRTAQERLQKLKELAPVASRQADMLEALRQSGFVSEAAHNEKLLGKIENVREQAVQNREF